MESPPPSASAPSISTPPISTSHIPAPPDSPLIPGHRIDAKQPTSTTSIGHIDIPIDRNTITIPVQIILEDLKRETFTFSIDHMCDVNPTGFLANPKRVMAAYLLRACSDAINPLHHQRVLLRDIIPTVHADLHLVWSGRTIYIKPLPECRPLLDNIGDNASLHSMAAAGSLSGFLRTYCDLLQSPLTYPSRARTGSLAARYRLG